MLPKSLEDEVVMITGAARGIGKAVAIRVASLGADVVAVDLHRSDMDSVVKEVKSLGRNCIAKEADVSNWDSIKELVSEVISEFKKIDVLVNNAAILGSVKTLLNTSEEEWDRTIDVNLKSLFNCSKAVLDNMLQRKKGKIINISSTAGLIGDSFVDYCSSKAGVIGFTMALARELFSTGIMVNAIAPGAVNAPMFRQAQEILKKLPEPFYLGAPEDIADGVVFLILNNLITGETINMSGGYLISI